MFQRLLAGLALAAVSTGAVAAEFCVATLGELQTALFAAGSNGEADDIRIVQGLYVATSASIYSPSEAMDLDITGGWDALCQSQVDDPSLTILDGGQSTSLLAMTTASSAGLSLRNMTVQNGVRAEGGAGLFVRTLGDVTIDQVKFLGNRHTGGLYYGGAVFIERASNVNVLGSYFADNEAIVGAGIDVRSCESMTVSGSTFERNVNRTGGNGPHAGSAISVADASSAGVKCRTVDIQQSQFTGNVMAPLALQVRARITLSESTFASNTVHDSAIAINKLACGMLRADGNGLVQPGDSGDVIIERNSFTGSNHHDIACLWLLAEKVSVNPSTMTIASNSFSQFDGSAVRHATAAECDFHDNEFRNLSGGTALQPWCNDLEIRRNRFIDVSARNYDRGKMGSLINGAPSAIIVDGFSEAIRITDNLFVRNHSIGASPAKSDGGAVRVEFECYQNGCPNRLTTFADITNNTFVDNRSDTNGGSLAIWSELDDNQNVRVYNNLFVGSMAAGVGKDVYFDNDADNDFLLTGFTAHGNNLQLSNGGWATKVAQPPPSIATNFDNLTPFFADHQGDDYRLSVISPLVDVGVDSAPSISTIDLDGNVRVHDAHVDLGALESIGDVAAPDPVFRDGFD